MADQDGAIAVALLYDATDRVGHLRETLAGMGASIVYEAPTYALDRDALGRSQASVVVVNLDAQQDEGLERVYELLDDARYRVIFNDSDVSDRLSGWDQARWARHLTAKIVGEADIDPPRPSNAQAVPVRVVAPLATPMPTSADAESEAIERAADEAALPGTDAPTVTESQAYASRTDANTADPEEPARVSIDSLIDFPADAAADAGMGLLVDLDGEGEGSATASSEQLASPMAVDPQVDIADIEDLLTHFEAVHAGDTTAEFADAAPNDVTGAADEHAYAARADISDASEIAFDEDRTAAIPPRDGRVEETPSVPAVAVPLSWALEDMIGDVDELAPVPSTPRGAAEFGIQKLRAEEFLAPPTEGAAAPPELDYDLSLELIPLDEAVAPVPVEATSHENWLDPDSRVTARPQVRRIWVLGASIGGPESVREFLAQFPHSYPALFVLVQHLGSEFVDLMTQQLARATPLTIRTPSHGERVGHGEVVVVPSSHRLLIDPEGVVVLERIGVEAAYSPSIDRVLHDVADRFGAAAGAIVFSGMSNDAVEGCIYLAGKGGAVYVQTPHTCVVSTMVDGVNEAGVAGFSGSPRELADKLLAERN